MIPFERQIYNRSCGAAALTMVYKSFNIDCNQEEIWRNISLPDSNGTLFTKSFCICRHALNNGLSSIIVNVKDDRAWDTLKLCNGSAIRIILNHRLDQHSHLGHYTVLLRIVDDAHIEIHDPQKGERQRLSKEVLKIKWHQRSSEDEITGRILIAFSRNNVDEAKCEFCGANIPESIYCPSCRNEVFLHPKKVIGCIKKNCNGRNWDNIICPYCNNSIFRHGPSITV